MKNVLIIGYPWPYIGGSKRVVGLANYLAEFGWQSYILTAPLKSKPPEHLRVIETGYEGILGKGARLLGLDEKIPVGEQVKERVRGLSPMAMSILRWGSDIFREVYAYPDEHKGWTDYALQGAEAWLRDNQCDALLSVWPYSTHVVAQELKRRHGIPWLADLADLWSDNSAYPYGKVRKWFDTRLEKRTLKDADVLTTSSWPLAERLARIHEGKKIYSAIIGFDLNFTNPSVRIVRERFTITYTGVFYWKKRDPYPFFKALAALVKEGRIDPMLTEVQIYGPDPGWIQNQIRSCNITSMVKQYPSIPLEECYKKQMQSHVLLQINWNDIKEKGVFSGKFLDYLAAQRPILAAGGTGNDEVVIEILNETNAGIYAVTVEDIKNAIECFYHEYQEKGDVTYRGNLQKVNKYSNREMAGTFASILNEISETDRHSLNKSP